MGKNFFSSVMMLLTVLCAIDMQAFADVGSSVAPTAGTMYSIDSLGFTTVPIIPVAKDGKAEWKYVVNEPTGDWMSKDYDDSSWSNGYGGFGSSNTYKNTAWTSSDIWLRKEFSFDGYSEQVLDSLCLMVYHDENCEIYINGVLASELGGYVTKYKKVTISENAKKSIVFGEKNVISVHCYNGGGAQFIDVGIYKNTPCTYITFVNSENVETAVWKYVTEAPDSASWMLPDFDDTTWSEGAAGFGKSRTSYAINTEWTTTDLWLRKNISFKGFSRKDLDLLQMYLTHDCTCEIYLNGVLASEFTLNGIKNEYAALSSDALDAVSLDGETTVAIHCFRKNSLRHFDVKISCTLSRLLDKIKWEIKEEGMKSKFAGDIDVNNVWGEYPRPQMAREEWCNLNGLWEFQPLFSERDGLPEDAYSMEILVPFPVESSISGIMKSYDRFAYRRNFTVPENWKEKRMLLHFEAVDFECEVFVNGKSVGSHKGGYDPFSFEITDYLSDDEQQELVVKVYDPTDLGGQPRGKQTLTPGGIMYTCTSGIWQSVWMEPVEDTYIDKYTVLPNIDDGTVTVNVTVEGEDAKLYYSVLENGTVVSTAESMNGNDVVIPIDNAKLWSPDSPFLYDLDITAVVDGDTVDVVKGYFGMRKISLENVDGYTRMCLNNEPLFHMGTLDQGFWPDGIYTAPTDAAMLYDIEATKQMGFNMIRKHIKVEPRRWYYYCDKIGLLVWQDMPSPNSYCSVHPDIDKEQYRAELKAMIEKHYNSPCIIMWVQFNENQARHDVESNVNYIKSLDSSRLVNQDSGGALTAVGDIWDLHHYPNPGFSASSSKKMATVCGEYGGLAYKVQGHLWSSSYFGYATMSSVKELKDTYSDYIDDLVVFRYCLGMSGAVYTQITDVEIEINGLMTYDREIDKVPYEEMAAINNKIVKAKLKKDTILAAAIDGGEKWKMTTTQPSDDWYFVDFDDSAWKEKLSGFGTSGTPNAKIGTTWSSSDIWIRKTFRLDGLNRELADSLVMIMAHDEDCEIYVNGKLLASYTGYENNYSGVDFTSEVKNALVYDSDNIIAVHCHQTTGGQYIDLGIYLLTENGMTTSVNSVIDESKPYIDIDEDNKTVAIIGGGFGENTELEVMTVGGIVVKREVVGNSVTNLSSLAGGVYVLRYKAGDKSYVCKITL